MSEDEGEEGDWSPSGEGDFPDEVEWEGDSSEEEDEEEEDWELE